MQKYKYQKYKRKVIKEMQKKVMEYLRKTKNPYQIKGENIIVQMEYSENCKQFNECMLNILKQKSKMG